MLVAFPFCHKDFKRTQEQLRWIGELDRALPRHKALLVASSQIGESDLRETIRLAKAVFGEVQAVKQRDVEESGWPRSCNRLFQVAANYVRDTLSEPFYWCEPDVVPLVYGWLDLLQAEYVRGGKPFMGVIYPWVSSTRRLPHLTGCAVYPANIGRYNPYALQASLEPWDVTRPELTLRHTYETRLMAHDWEDRDKPSCWPFPDQDSLKRLPAEAVVWHPCKSGDLLERLRERLFRERPKPLQPRTLVEKMKHAVVQVLNPRLQLDQVTLVCVDTIRPDLAWKGVKACLDKVAFGDVKFFTNTHSYPHAVKIPEIAGIEGYNRFMVKELHKHIKTSHALICQWDGFVVDAKGWTDEFLRWDYIGAPWRLVNTTRRVGNGGFSLRSLKLLRETAKLPPPYHPEDQVICVKHAGALEASGVRFAPVALAERFSCELGRYSGQFGFHSFQTKLPAGVERPAVFHHTGLIGDAIYACAAIADFGLGCLFISPEVKGPRVRNVGDFMNENRYTALELATALSPLLRVQPYIADCRMASHVPSSTDVDFNLFRINYKPDGGSLVRKQCQVAGANWPDDKPWLQVDFPMMVPKRPIVVHRSPRYHNPYFPWARLVADHGHQMVMVGSREEYFAFASEFGAIPHVATSDLLGLARLISGAKVFIGNQSSPMAIALGLGRPVIQEVFLEDPNCQLRRPKALYVADGKVEIPRRWLK